MYIMVVTVTKFPTPFFAMHIGKTNTTVNDELERAWKGVVVAYLGYYPSIGLER
jgi:hypothetical protein